MPAFGCNQVTLKFAQKVLREPLKGFRLSDRVVSAIDRFIGALVRFQETGKSLMDRWLFIYPFVGATDWTHSLNLADVGGNFERFRMTWSGSVIHNELGVTMTAGSEGNTHCDCADAWKAPPAGCSDAWNRKTFGVYIRTNSAVNIRDVDAQFVEPRNGYLYWQAIHGRWGDGICYCDLVGTSYPVAYNRAQVYVGDSLGLITQSQRGPTVGPYHYIYKRGAYIGSDYTGEIGMGYGDGLGLAVMKLLGTGRSYGFFFSTKHPQPLEGTVNTDGSGGMLPGFAFEFDLFVEQLQVALLRNV